MNHTRRIFYLLLTALAGTLSGCGSDPGWKRESFAFAMPPDPAAPPAATNLVALSKVVVSPLCQSRSFVYHMGNGTYEQDPYAGFATAPERALAEPIRGWLMHDGEFGRVIEPGSGLMPSIVIEAHVDELCCNFHTNSPANGTMKIHFIAYEMTADGPGRILLDDIYERHSPVNPRTPAALMAAWDKDLQEIMQQLDSDYGKTHFINR